MGRRSKARIDRAPRGTRAGLPRPPGSSPPTIGVDLGGTKIATAVITEDGRVLASHRHPTETDASAQRVIAAIANCIETCLGDVAKSAGAVGIGVAGQVTPAGVLESAPNLPWGRLPLRSKIEQAVALPTIVVNDVRAATFGEWKFGAGRGESDVVCLFIGTGVGGGIVADGHLRNGATNTAGELGHITIQLDGRKCHCPNSGCLEAYVSGWAIGERAREIAATRPVAAARLLTIAGKPSAIRAETVTEAYRAGDALAQQILEKTVEYLAAGVVSIVNSFNPSVVILGGGVIEGLPSLIPPTEALVRQQALEVAVRDLRIVRAGLGPEAGVMGAAALARAKVARRGPR